MPPVRKRRAQAVDNDDDDDVQQTQTQTQTQTQRRRGSDSSEDVEMTQADGDATSQQQMIKNLVRLALATEYNRAPLRRTDIAAKVLGTNSRQFKHIFDGAQLALRQTFGMELVELPTREKVTLAQRKAAQKSTASSSNSSKSWILKSMLPDKLQHPDIITPPKVPTEELEATYVGLYTFIVGVITLSGGSLPEAKLNRQLKRTNMERNTPLEKTDKLLARMIKDGYLVKIKENNGGEEQVDYYVGPRGKIEIGLDGISKLVKVVYGEEMNDELLKRLESSLKAQAAALNAKQNAVQDAAEGAIDGEGRRARAKPRRANGAGREDSGNES